MFKYITVEENFEDSELGNYTSYGITVMCGNKTIFKISDISLNRTLVCELVSLCNKLQLDPMHLYDVIEDFLP